MKRLICAALISSAVIAPAIAKADNVNAAPILAYAAQEQEGIEMPNVVGEQYQKARDGLMSYFDRYAIRTNIDISFVNNTDSSLNFKVKSQDLPAGSKIQSGSIDIHLVGNT